jgi:hypothetical protein
MIQRPPTPALAKRGKVIAETVFAQGFNHVWTG